LSDNGTMVVAKEPRRAVLTPLAVPMSLAAFVSSHLGVHGTYSFVLPDLAAGAIRQLRDPDAADEDDD
jgi:hypothetical protein